jgi:hypothetical protein
MKRAGLTIEERAVLAAALSYGNSRLEDNVEGCSARLWYGAKLRIAADKYAASLRPGAERSVS